MNLQLSPLAAAIPKYSDAKKIVALSFDVSPHEAAIIGQIVQRAIYNAHCAAVKLDHVQIAMDVTACHCNGTPIKLLQLLMADNSDFDRDIIGIGRNINRENGQLMNSFKLRFSEGKH